MRPYLHTPIVRQLLSLMLSASLIASLPALATNVSLATSPLANSSALSVAPNLMFMLDDSGSMDWDYMPDNAKNFAGKYGYNSSQCNGVYYDPDVTYTPPINSAGQPLNATTANPTGSASFTAAWKDGYNTTLGVTNLSTGFTGGSGGGSSGINLTAGSAFYYNYTGTLTGSANQDYFNTSSPFYLECNSAIGATPGSGKFTKVTVTSTSAEAQNFANWYSYYSTRMMMMKTGVGEAFKSLNNRFRIGYMSMNNNNGTDIADIAAFAGGCAVNSLACQKDKWYNKLYAANPGQSTPLRRALSQVGQLYANKFTATTTYVATITITGGGTGSGGSVSSITVPSGGTELMAAASTANTSTSTIARNIASQINAITTSPFDAVANGSVVTITGPSSANSTLPAVASSGGMTFTQTAFTATTTAAAKLNGITPADPIQYSCQKNFVILSTDGYWNGAAGYKLDGSAIGNQDGTANRPMYDGAVINKSTSQIKRTSTKVAMTTSQLQQTQSKSSNLQQSTSTLQSSAYPLIKTTTALNQSDYALIKTTTALNQSDWQLQSQTSTLQASTMYLQTRTSTNSGGTWTAWASTLTCTWDTSTPTLRQCRYATTATGATAWTAAAATWSDVMTGTCTVNPSTGTTGTWSGNKTNCQYTAYTSASPASTCKVITPSTTSPYSVLTATACSYSATSVDTLNVTSCSPLARSFSTANNTQYNTPAVTCAYATTSTVTNPASACTIATQSSGTGTWSGPAVSCSYGPAVVTNNVTSCSPLARSISTANNTQYNTPAVTCAYATTSTVTNPASACTIATQSSGTGTWSGPAVSCSYGPAVVTSGASAAPCTTSPKTPATTDGTNYNASAITCGYSAPVVSNVSTCTPITASTGDPYTVASGVSCAYTTWPAAWTNVSAGTCTNTPQDTTTFNMTATAGVAKQCQAVGTGTCASGTTCATVTTGGPTNYVASCTAASTPIAGSPPTGNNFTTTACTTTAVETNNPVAACTLNAVDSTSPFAKTTACNTVSTGPTTVSSCTAETATASNSYTATTCSGGAGGTSDTLADTAMYYYQTDLRDPSLNNCTGVLGTAGGDVCENNVRTSGGDDNNEKQHLTTLTLGLGARGKMAFSTSYLDDTPTTNSIRDYYDVHYGTAASSGICSWQTSGACNWPAPPTGGSDPTTIDDLWHAAVDGRGLYFSATNPTTLAVGLSTALKSIDSKSGAAAAAATSTLNPVANNNFAYVASYTTVKWSGNLEQRDIDTTTGAVSRDAGWCVQDISLSTCIAPRQIVRENISNSTSYYCSSPATDVRAPVGIDALDCTAPDVLTTVNGTQVCRTQIHSTCTGTMPNLVDANTDKRKIYTQAGGVRVEFKPTDTTFTTAYASNFATAHISDLSQWPAIVTAGKQSTAAGANLINYLRGQNAYEENRTSYVVAGNTIHDVSDWLYRYREDTLGDALESQPTYIGPPTFSYLDPGYAAFATQYASRVGMVFIGTNDGMLHAFHASDKPGVTQPCVSGTTGSYCGGEEAWAYVPSMVIPNMYKLADTSYDVKHVNFVNGSATISDICISACNSSSAVWKTILVGGLNGGGRGYYALDVTDPTATDYPKVLWEFTPASTGGTNLGYSFGRPIITKKQNGKWVVLVTSGYDNGTLAPDGTTYSNPGDGGGYLYVLDAATGSTAAADGGAIISTGVADTATPSGLAKFDAYSDVTDSNQAGFVYGGDLQGNLWRFNINKPASTTATPPNPFKLAELKAGTTPQPITVAPTLGKIDGQRVVFVGTGKYLESNPLTHNDLADTQQQTLYAIKDNQNGATAATLPDPRSSTTMVHQTMTQTGSIRTNSTPAAVDWTTKRGWYVDFIDSKERVNISAKLVQGTLIVPSIVPADSICTPGGYGWLNYFDYKNGGPIDFTNSIVAVKTDSTIVGVNLIYINKRPIVEYVSSSDPTPTIPPPKTGGAATTACTGPGCEVDRCTTLGGGWCQCGRAICPLPLPTNPGDFFNQREMWRELVPQ